MSKKVLASVVAVLALVGCVKTGEVFAAANQVALEESRDRAAQTVRQVTGRTGADKYIVYLNGLIEKADCYIGGPLDTCNYSDGEVEELTAALNEGAKATIYLTTEHQSADDTTATGTSQATATSVAQSTVAKTSNAKNKNSEMPTSLPEAAYETGSVAKDNDRDDDEANSDDKTEEEIVEVPETSEKADEQAKTGVKDNAPVRVGLAVLAGVVVLTGGVVVIRKWSRGDV